MGKASSSRKKERSKTSSSQRSRRKSKSSRKLKSKKLRYRHDSPSCSDTDFESSTSVSSSSSEDDTKVRRSRSKTRKNVKPSKKRSKKQSHDCQSRECSPHPRKRKHLKRNDHCEVEKANKKKRRRDVSVGAYSDSLSCSTCGNGSTTSNESEVVRRRGRTGKRKRNMGKTERSRYRSKSRSPCSLCSEGSDYQNEVDDDSYVENNFRRLRSIIVVVGEEKKLKTVVGNEQQEGVTHQPDDDHPSFGDLDSNHATNKRKLDYVISEEAPLVGNKEAADIPNNSNSMVVKDDGVQNEEIDKNHGGVSKDHSLDGSKNGCSGNTDSINCIDLESILRQRALENLRKFKGAAPRNVETIANCKVDNNSDAKQLYSPVSKSVHVTSPRDDAKINSKGFSRQGGGNAVNSVILEENGVKSMDATDSAVASIHDPVYSSQNLGRISNESNGMNELKQDISSLDQEVINDSICQKADADICSTTNRSNLVIAALRPESKVDSLIKQASASEESIQTKASISDIGLDETAQTQTQIRNNDDQNIRNGLGSSAHKPSSSLNSISGEEGSLNMSRHESGEGSQFEQKTMSVMRGGEMVQVNYKVYIPKRAPALTRRQLKR